MFAARGAEAVDVSDATGLSCAEQLRRQAVFPQNFLAITRTVLGGFNQ
jgi:hypothetical protein